MLIGKVANRRSYKNAQAELELRRMFVKVDIKVPDRSSVLSDVRSIDT